MFELIETVFDGSSFEEIVKEIFHEIPEEFNKMS